MATITSQSTASEIDAFTESAVSRIKSLDEKGILTCTMNISYNESYFNEKPGLLKQLIREAVSCQDRAVQLLRDVVPTDVTALAGLHKAKDSLERVAADLLSIGDILSVGEAGMTDNMHTKEQSLMLLNEWGETGPVIDTLNELLVDFGQVERPTVSTEDDQIADGDETDVTESKLQSELLEMRGDADRHAANNLDNQKSLAEQSEEQDEETQDAVDERETQVSIYEENITRGGLLDKANTNYSNHATR